MEAGDKATILQFVETESLEVNLEVTLTGDTDMTTPGEQVGEEDIQATRVHPGTEKRTETKLRRGLLIVKSLSWTQRKHL